MMDTHLPSFQRYQLEFTAHIRDPLHQPRPKNVPVKRMAVYKEIVFNNLLESISACFPVAQKMLGMRAWLNLTHGFLREHSGNTPIFREIPEEFLAHVNTQTNLPHYLSSLCHYEWVELFVASMDTTSAELGMHIREITTANDLLEFQPAFTAALQILNYDYAVQKISPRHKPKQKVSTQLLIYRDVDFAVKFVELNPVTYRLIELLQQQSTTGMQALSIIADELSHPKPEIIIQFGLAILQDLKKQGIISGVIMN